jgi:hypothetical protein
MLALPALSLEGFTLSFEGFTLRRVYEGSFEGKTLHRRNGSALTTRSLEGFILRFEGFIPELCEGGPEGGSNGAAKSAFLIETRKRLKIAVTRTNQTTDTRSNRVNFAGSLERDESATAADSVHGARAQM